MTTTTALPAGDVPTRQDEFAGAIFYGTGTKPKGRFVSARRCGPGQRHVEVTFEARTPFGPYSVTEFTSGRVVRFDKETD